MISLLSRSTPTRAYAQKKKEEERNKEIEERIFFQMLTHLCHLPIVRRHCGLIEH